MSQECDPLLVEEANCQSTSAWRLEVLSADAHLRVIVAGNPAASTVLLARLAEDQDVRVRKAVASNPNTPWVILEQLAWAFPQVFLHNPVGALQIVAYPQQICADATFWHVLLQEAAIPAVWWNWLRNHPVLGASQTLRLHIQYAGETMYPQGVSQEKDEHTLLILLELLVAAAAQRASLATLTHAMLVRQAIIMGEIVGESLQSLMQSIDEEVSLAAAELPQSPLEVLDTLTRAQETEGRGEVSANTQISVEALRVLAQDPDIQVRKDAARHPQAPVDVLQMLAQDENIQVRRWVAWNAQTPVEVLHVLAQDQEISVRINVASHPQMPVEALYVLSRDCASVRRNVSRHPQVPVEILQILALDEDIQVRRTVARHERIPGEMWEILARDQDEQVRKEVAGNRQTPVEMLCILARDQNADVRQNVARHAQTPIEVLWSLAQDHVGYVRRAVASHLHTPAEVLQLLAQDTVISVRCAVARNVQTPIEIVRILDRDVSEDVRWEAQLVETLLSHGEARLSEKNWETLSSCFDEDGAYRVIRKAPIEEQLDVVAALDAPEQLRQTIIAVLVADWNVMKVRAAFALSETSLAAMLKVRRYHYRCVMAPFLPPGVLQKLAASSCWEVRYLVALHRRTPGETRQRLSRDANRYVRAVARANMAVEA